VDIPAAHSTRFPQHLSSAVKTTAVHYKNITYLNVSFIRADPRKFVPVVFLMCTKNTELTRDHFARRVTFALINSFQQFKPVLDRIYQFLATRKALGARQMKSEEWKSYRTRFLVNAKQLSSSLSFIDHLGRQHCGRKGDYLVESSDGVLSIAPRRIFEDIYTAMPQQNESGHAETAEQETERTRHKTAMSERRIDMRQINLDRFEPLQIEDVRLPKSVVVRQRRETTPVDADPAARVQRKLPQPCRDRRSASNRIGLM
jgi:hypothetical protein